MLFQKYRNKKHIDRCTYVRDHRHSRRRQTRPHVLERPRASLCWSRDPFGSGRTSRIQDPCQTFRRTEDPTAHCLPWAMQRQCSLSQPRLRMDGRIQAVHGLSDSRPQFAVGNRLTRYQPVGWSFFGFLSTDVRTNRTLGLLTDILLDWNCSRAC